MELVLKIYIGLLIFGVIYAFWQGLCLKFIGEKPPAEAIPYGHRGVVILPTYNDAGLLEAISTLMNQTFKDFDLVIVDDGSPFGLMQFIEQEGEQILKELFSGTNGEISIITLGRNSGSKAKAMQSAIRHIEQWEEDGREYHWVVVMDGDTLLKKDAIELLVKKLLASNKVAAVSGNVQIIPRRKAGFWEAIQLMEHVQSYPPAKSYFSRFHKVPVVSGALSIHSRDALRHVGWWKPDWIVEDVTWTWLAIARGWKILYEMDAVGYTEAQPNTKGLINQRRRWFRGRWEAFYEVAKLKGVIHPMTAYFLAWLVGCAFNVFFFLIPSMLAAMFYPAPYVVIILAGMVALSVVNSWQQSMVDRFQLKTPTWCVFFVNAAMQTLETVAWWRCLTDVIFRKGKSWMTR